MVASPRSPGTRSGSAAPRSGGGAAPWGGAAAPTSWGGGRARGAGVRVVRAGPRGVDLTEALGTLRASGIRSLLVEGGAGVITSLLAEGHEDRVVVGVAPRILGSGTEAVGDL